MQNVVTPTETAQYFETGRGDAITKQRRHELELAVTDPISVRHLDLMKRATDGRPGSPRLLGVEAVLIGYDKHCSWYEPTALGITAVRQGFGGFAGARVRMVSSVFEPSIWQDESLIHGVPWHRLEAIYNGDLGAHVLPGPASYEGPFWRVAAAAEVDVMGTLSTGTAQLDLVLPIGGATVQLGPEAGVTGTLIARDFDGSPLGVFQTGDEVMLPVRTWSIGIEVDAATVQPRLRVLDAGRRLPPRVAGEELG